MESGREDQIIELALKKGLLSRADLGLIKGESANDRTTIKVATDQSRLAQLIEAGLISAALIESLERELDSQPEPITPPAKRNGIASEAAITLKTAESRQADNSDNSTDPHEKATERYFVGKDGYQTLIDLHDKNSQKPSLRRRHVDSQIGHYELEKLLGEGGMGSVYKAYDPALKRYVALKFLHASDKESIKRLLMEGRAQARIEHPNICRVYEVGECNEQFYVVMQYIDGKTLGDAMSEMTIEQKVKALADAAEGLHAAHKEGLIHRDIKPHNIMVEKTAEGNWKPYVMDFGLVREVSQKGITMTGEVLGTPCYMPPEQARGKTALMDRRSDIYSLGATLYELLSGQPPFEGFSVMEVLMLVLKTEPKPLRQLAANIPVDLETIVMKCLEKDQMQRYDSAKALAEDLRRYLDGEPIAGKRTSLGYRLRKQISRHRTLVAVMSVACFIVMLMAAFMLYGEWQSLQRARLARQFGEQLKDIESIMRYGHMSPRHDINQEASMVRAQMTKVTESMTSLGQIGEGPGYYALGRGSLALGEYGPARDYLTRAWQCGYREPAVAYALGIALGRLYQHRVLEVRQIGNKDLREAEQKLADENLKKPALNYLAQGTQAMGESAEFGEALIAYYEYNFDKALSKAEAAKKQIPWLYEAKRLIGDIHLEIAIVHLNSKNLEKAGGEFEQARLAYQQTIEMAASDPEIYQQLSTLWLNIAMQKNLKQAPVDEAITNAFKMADQAIETDPRRAHSYKVKADIYRRTAGFKSDRGVDPSEEYARAVVLLKQAAELQPNQANFYYSIGQCYFYNGEYRRYHGQSTDMYQQAIAYASKALDLDANFGEAYELLANVYTSEGENLRGLGKDPMPSFDRAIDFFRKGLTVAPASADGYSSLGSAYELKGRMQSDRGEDASEAYEAGIANFRKAVEIDPAYPPGWLNFGSAYLEKVRLINERGGDPNATLDESIKNYQKAAELDPNSSITRCLIGFGYLEKARYLLNQNADPGPMLAKAQEFIDQAIKLNANDYFNEITLGDLYLVKARDQFNRNEDPTAALALAVAACERARQINAGAFDNFLQQGNAELLQARWQIKLRQSPLAALTKARTDFNRAIEMKADFSDCYRALAEWYQYQTESMLTGKNSALDSIAQGLKAIEQALKLKPNFAEAFAVQGKLQLLALRNSDDAAERARRAKAARESFQIALKINKSLSIRYRDEIAEAARFAE